MNPSYPTMIAKQWQSSRMRSCDDCADFVYTHSRPFD